MLRRATARGYDELPHSMNIYQKDFNRKPEIFRLIKARDNTAAKDHLRRHPDEVLLQGWMDDTPLHIAAGADNLEMVEFLVQNGADVNASRSGRSPFPLHWAKSVAVAKHLLDHGAKLDARALEAATRCDVPEIIALLLDRGATWPAQSPPYLSCRSIAAIQVYVNHGTKLDAGDEQGRHLLHHLAWNDMPDEFDFAYAHGAPWNQDICRLDPYYFAKSGGRRKTMAHIAHRYPERVARTVRSIKATEIHFRHVSHLKPCAAGGNAVLAWTYGERLGRIEIHDGRWMVTTAVHVNVCGVHGFCIDDDGDILLPTNDAALLVLDAVTLQWKRTIALAMGMDVQHIDYLPSRRLYLAHGDNRNVYLLNLDFELVKCHSLSDRPYQVQRNAPATLVCTRHFDQEMFHLLHHLDENLVLTQLVNLEDKGHGHTTRVALGDHDVVVNDENVVVAYRHGNDIFEESWRLPLDRFPSKQGMSCALFVGTNHLFIGKGGQLVHIDMRIPAITGVAALELDGDIMNLYLDASGEYLIVRAAGLKLVRLDRIQWDEPR